MIRILSIDGGGVRGILAAEILARLEEMIIEITDDPAARLSDYFDLVAGTSTGGILSCIYLKPSPENPSKPQYSASEASQLYMDNAKKIFKLSRSESEAKYSGTELTRVLQTYFGDVRLSDLLRPCLITSFNIKRNSTHFFSSHDAVFNPGYDYPLYQVALATSAAPGFFNPAEVLSQAGKPYHLVDGGVFANNPALCAFAEARSFFGNRSGIKIRATDMFIVSVGTGKVAGTDFSKKGIAPEYVLSRESETTHYQLMQIFEAADAMEHYYRLDPYLGMAREEMDDTSDENLVALKEAGSYSGDMLSFRLRAIATKLVSYSALRK